MTPDHGTSSGAEDENGTESGALGGRDVGSFREVLSARLIVDMGMIESIAGSPLMSI